MCHTCTQCINKIQGMSTVKVHCDMGNQHCEAIAHLSNSIVSELYALTYIASYAVMVNKSNHIFRGFRSQQRKNRDFNQRREVFIILSLLFLYNLIEFYSLENCKETILSFWSIANSPAYQSIQIRVLQ